MSRSQSISLLYTDRKFYVVGNFGGKSLTCNMTEYIYDNIPQCYVIHASTST